MIVRQERNSGIRGVVCLYCEEFALAQLGLGIAGFRGISVMVFDFDLLGVRRLVVDMMRVSVGRGVTDRGDLHFGYLVVRRGVVGGLLI